MTEQFTQQSGASATATPTPPYPFDAITGDVRPEKESTTRLLRALRSPSESGIPAASALTLQKIRTIMLDGEAHDAFIRKTKAVPKMHDLAQRAAGVFEGLSGTECEMALIRLRVAAVRSRMTEDQLASVRAWVEREVAAIKGMEIFDVVDGMDAVTRRRELVRQLVARFEGRTPTPRPRIR